MASSGRLKLGAIDPMASLRYRKDVPGRHEHRGDHRPDDKTIETEHRYAAQRGNQHDVVGNFGFLADQNRPQNVIATSAGGEAFIDLRGGGQATGAPADILRKRVNPGSGSRLTETTIGGLRAAILDADGKPVVTSPQVQFHVRQPSILSPQSPQAPPKPPKPTPKPRPKG